MSTNQKYSGRIHARRQLVSVDKHLISCVNLLTDIGITYIEAKPEISNACQEMITTIAIIAPIINKVRENI